MNLFHKNKKNIICILILILAVTLAFPVIGYGAKKKKKKVITTPVNVSTCDLKGYVTTNGLKETGKKEYKALLEPKRLT